MLPANDDARRRRLTFRDLLSFMPEGLGALAIVIGAPIYGVGLIRRGLLLPAFSLALGLCVVVFLAYRGFSRHSKVLIYVAILAALGVWFVINYWVGTI